MPSSLHEVRVEIFRQRPSLAAELLTDALGVELPSFGDARLEPADLVDLAPTEYRADAVVVLSDAAWPVRAVVVEVQLRRDDDKHWTWPVYLNTLRARLRCPTLLLVICIDEATAAWAAKTIELGQPGSTLTPLVSDRSGFRCTPTQQPPRLCRSGGALGAGARARSAAQRSPRRAG